MKSMKSFLIALFWEWLILSGIPLFSQEIPYKSQAEIEKENLEKLKIVKGSIAFSLQYGHFELFKYAKTSNDTSNIKVGDYHNQFNLLVEYYFYEKVAALFSLGLIIIPKQETIDNISWKRGAGVEGVRVNGSGKGGIIFPVTMGIKKTFLDGLARPYVSILSGFTYIKIGSGTGTGSIYGMDKTTEYQSELKLCWQLGTGIQIRTGKVVRFDFGINYHGTPNISPSIGGVSSYSGLYLFGGINFILNPGRHR